MDESSQRSQLGAYLQPRSIFMLVLGFSSGLPFVLVGATLSLWLRQDHISRASIGLMSAATVAYIFKFAWAPLVDRVRLPVIGEMLGKRRAWILAAQLCVAAGLVAIAFSNPTADLTAVAVAAVFTGFAGATQDISIDAWRIESAPTNEQGAMAAMYQLGYRLAIIASGAGALYIAQFASWRAAYIGMAALMLLGPVAIILAPRPKEGAGPIPGEQSVENLAAELHLKGFAARAFEWLYSAVVAPFVDFFARHGLTALVILALIGVYRLPDFVMGVMAQPLYVDLGFSLATIATVVKIFGVWMTIAGALIGGLAVARIGMMRTLLVGIVASIVGNLIFAWLATQGGSVRALAVAISCENFAGGFAGTALIAYMSSLTSSAFTATQYALFTSAYALPGKLVGLASGYLVDWFSGRPSLVLVFGGASARTAGYVPFFFSTAAMGIPGVLLVLHVARLERSRAAANLG
jgi:PAT family beta-lactamase induction signal transducer AmpG